VGGGLELNQRLAADTVAHVKRQHGVDRLPCTPAGVAYHLNRLDDAVVAHLEVRGVQASDRLAVSDDGDVEPNGFGPAREDGHVLR
jgi:hypothetical protein